MSTEPGPEPLTRERLGRLSLDELRELAERVGVTYWDAGWSRADFIESLRGIPAASPVRPMTPSPDPIPTATPLSAAGDWIDHLPGVTSVGDLTFGELMVPVSAIRQHFAARQPVVDAGCGDCDVLNGEVKQAHIARDHDPIPTATPLSAAEPRKSVTEADIAGRAT